MSLKSIFGLLLVFGANSLLFWILCLRRRASSQVSLLGAVVVALVVSVMVHVAGGLADRFPQAFALAVISIPFVWLQGFLTNLAVRFLWEKRVPTPS
jgi:hypothetical protein